MDEIEGFTEHHKKRNEHENNVGDGGKCTKMYRIFMSMLLVVVSERGGKVFIIIATVQSYKCTGVGDG